MTWLAIRESRPRGAARHATRWDRALAGPGLLARGTIVLEADTLPGAGDQPLLAFWSSTGWPRGLSLGLAPDGTLRASLRQGPAQLRARLHLPPPAPRERLRVWLSWNAPARLAHLSAENLDDETLWQTDAPAPPPLPRDDARRLFAAPRQPVPGLVGAALSDRVEPLGLPLGLRSGTLIETDSGPRPIEALAPGDRVLTARGFMAPVRWVVRREVPGFGRFAPVRLRRPYFGLARSIEVAPDHRIFVTGAEAAYLFGDEGVLVRAADLVDGRSVVRSHGPAEMVEYCHLLLDEHECLHSSGLWSESLFVGEVARNAATLATTPLAGMAPGAVPRHKRFAHAPLSPREAHTLRVAMGA